MNRREGAAAGLGGDIERGRTVVVDSTGTGGHWCGGGGGRWRFRQLARRRSGRATGEEENVASD